MAGQTKRDRFTIITQRISCSRDIADRTGGAPDAAAHAVCSPAPQGVAADLVGRWLALAELERRAFAALTRELTVSSDLVERSTLDLSQRFQELAGIAQSQVGRMDKLIDAASAIEVDGDMITLDAALHSVETTLSKAIETVLFVSKHAMRMVYTLEDVARDVAAAQACSGQIEKINRQARYLALNAAIEASRSGEAGAAFGIIAYEMKQLAQATEDTANEVRDRISSVTVGVRRGHEVMQEIATIDLSENIRAKERIDSLLGGIVQQHNAFNTVLSETAQSSSTMAGTIGQLITGMQFQDRTKQHIAQVIETLAVLAEGTEAVQRDSEAAFPGLARTGMIDAAALDRIIAKQTLGAMKTRILNRLLGDVPDDTADAAPEGADVGDIELF